MCLLAPVRLFGTRLVNEDPLSVFVNEVYWCGDSHSDTSAEFGSGSRLLTEPELNAAVPAMLF